MKHLIQKIYEFVCQHGTQIEDLDFLNINSQSVTQFYKYGNILVAKTDTDIILRSSDVRYVLLSNDGVISYGNGSNDVFVEDIYDTMFNDQPIVEKFFDIEIKVLQEVADAIGLETNLIAIKTIKYSLKEKEFLSEQFSNSIEEELKNFKKEIVEVSFKEKV